MTGVQTCALPICIGSLFGAYNAVPKAEGGIIGYKEGGEVGYADGGVMDLADFNFAKPSNKAAVDYQMKQAQQGLPTMIPFSTLRALDTEFKRLQQAPAGSPQTTVAQDLAMQVLAQSRPQSMGQGLGSLPAPNFDQEETFSAANGGIIAFAKGGNEGEPKITESDLDALRMVESNGDPNAVSNRNAMGEFQIIPTTAASPGFGIKPIDINDPSQHRGFAQDYLQTALNRYGGDKDKAFASYNAGIPAVDKAIKKAAKAGDETQWMNYLPEETRNYVPKIKSQLASSMKPDFVAKPEGIASQILSAATGSRPAYGAENAPSSTSDEQPESAIGAWFRRQKGADKYIAEERARQEALQNMYKSIVPFYEAVTPTQRRERDADYEKYRQQSMQYSGIATPSQADLSRAGEIATAPVEISPERLAELKRQKAAGEGRWKTTTPAVTLSPEDAAQNERELARTAKTAPASKPNLTAPASKPNFLDQVQQELFNNLKSDTVMSRDEYDRRMDNIAKKYGVDPESTKQFFDNQAKSLTDQVAQARKDRNVNLWMAAAQGFFAMAGGMSPYAFKNFADGMGVGTKQATAALNEFNKEQSEINKAQRELAKLQLIDRREMSKAEQDREVKYEKMVADHRDRQAKTLSTLFVGGTQREATQAQNAVANELKRQNLERQKIADYDDALRDLEKTTEMGLLRIQANDKDPAKARDAQNKIDTKIRELKRIHGIQSGTASFGFDPSAISAELARRGVK